MTDRTQPEAREFTMSQYASKDDMIGAMRKRIAELESELEAVGAGGVNGPLMGKPQAMPDLSQLTAREALRTIGDEQAFEAWFKMDCPVEGANAKIAAKSAWKARASISANAGGPVAHLWQHCETSRTRIVMPDMIVDADASWQVVGPLYLGAAPPTAQAEGWVSVDERLPAKYTEVLICFAESPLPSTGQYTGHAADPAGWCYPNESNLLPGESEKLPDGGAPTVTHWMPLPPPPTSAEGVEHG